MNAYPTRAEIDTTNVTLRRLRSHLGGELVHGLAWSAINDTLRILDNLDAFPGLHYPAAEPEPEPEPKPTAAKVLREAVHATDLGTPERGIILAAMHYAETGPKWFSDWHTFDWPDSALVKAAFEAAQYGDSVAEHLLTAAACVASAHRHLFGGAKAKALIEAGESE